MQAIILAAGMGKRLKDLTADKTKCMVEVNGVPLIRRMLRQLEQLNLDRIVVVVGYKGDLLKNYMMSLSIKTPLVYVENEIYDKTNNIYSLALAKEYLLEQDTILLESDLIFEDSILHSLIEDPRDTLALVDKYESWMDGTVVKLSENDEITAFVPGEKFVFEDIPQYYKTVNIYKFSREFSRSQYVPFLEAYSTALGNNEYYEQVLRVLTLLDNSRIRAKRVEGQKWYEIDDIQDLDIAASIFTEPGKQLDQLQSRYGGYWRYPKLLDFCYLVNPYFPPRRMLSEIKANADKLIMNYPSGARVNALLAAKNFSVKEEHIVVGNGAAELIKSVMEHHEGKIGFIRPTFEEYPNRLEEKDRVIYFPENENFSYHADDLISFFRDKEITMLVLINPDNPSGNYMEKKEVLFLLTWCRKNHITLLLDESFADFAEEEDNSEELHSEELNSFVREELLSQYENLIVVKSISKSYGVPGLRLGILASGNDEQIRAIKKDVSIWNINSLAEFYMQIEEKYEAEYREALKHFKAVRQRFLEELAKVTGLRVIPSQANYVMCELTGKRNARELTEKLLLDYNILIKDLTGKVKGTGQYVRIAIRSEEDNEKLIRALKELEEEGSMS